MKDRNPLIFIALFETNKSHFDPDFKTGSILKSSIRTGIFPPKSLEEYPPPNKIWKTRRSDFRYGPHHLRMVSWKEGNP